jgi:hypothetical protein
MAGNAHVECLWEPVWHTLRDSVRLVVVRTYAPPIIDPTVVLDPVLTMVPELSLDLSIPDADIGGSSGPGVAGDCGDGGVCGDGGAGGW